MQESPVSLAVVGAGAIGRRHIDLIVDVAGAELAGIVDPSPHAKELASAVGSAWYSDLESMLAVSKPEGIIIATPTGLHVAQSLQAIAIGIPVLVEKPIADNVEAATMLVETAETSHVPLLVGHHRRHNPILNQAKRAIDDGAIGRVVSVHGTCWFYKPEEYFAPRWRRERGAGPVLTNLIHDVDLLRYLCGEIVSVQAMASNQHRGFEIEDSAVVIVRFASGVLGTLTVSDTIVSPWSWELTSDENPDYPQTDESCCVIGGTHGSLAIPHLDLWGNASARSWFEPVLSRRLAIAPGDPLARQLDNFMAVIRKGEAPVVSGRDGLESLKVMHAIETAFAQDVATPI
jgi:predicted dehydrogenase